MSFQINSLYPEIRIQKNPDLGKKIQNIYAGKISEFLLFSTYLYQITVVENEELKKILENILNVTKKHLELLGSLIANLGLTPFFASLNKEELEWFNIKNINYIKDEKGMVLDDIYITKRLIEEYKKIKTKDAGVIKIIERIILEKEIHNEILKKYAEIKFRMT